MPRIPIIITDFTKDIYKATDSLPTGTPRPVPRIPIIIMDYTKDISKATDSFPAGTPRPMPRIPIIITDYTKDISKATERKQIERPVSFYARMMHWPSGSLPGILDYNLGPTQNPKL